MNRTPVILLVVLVLVAGAAIAWFFGLFAGVGYAMGSGFRDDSSNKLISLIGQGWGAFTGLLAGAIWCWVVIPRGIRSRGKGLGRAGAVAGLGVGILSTLLLHFVLTIASDNSHPSVWLIGLGCGVVAGLVLGAVCGLLCGVALRRTMQAPDQAGAEEAE